MNAILIDDVAERFAALNEQVPLHSIRSEAEYGRAVEVLDELLDAGGADEGHPLAGLVAALGGFIEEYDQAHYRLPDASGADLLQFLMTQHGLKQSDLPEIGSQGVVSEILRGKRELNTRQIRAAAERFGTSPGVFL